jgi:hypothetical protein
MRNQSKIMNQLSIANRDSLVEAVATKRTSLARLACAVLLAGIFGGASAGCHKGSVGGSESNLPQGSLGLHPGQPPSGGQMFLVEPNDGGRGSSLHILRMRWGKLADVRDQNGILRLRDFVVNENVQSGDAWTVEINPVSEKTSVTILHPFSNEATSDFVAAVSSLESDLTQLPDVSLSPSELPPFPLVPRNAVIVIHFDDLVDPNKVTADTIKVLRGYPPTAPFDARILPDPSHGDLADHDDLPGLEFYSTRILVDPTVSVVEAAQTSPPLPVNSLGLPASITLGQPNVALRIPTAISAEEGQTYILTNPTNHPVASTGNGSVDFTTPTRDVVRALRSGGAFLVTGDTNNGFLADAVPPNLLGTQAVSVTNVAAGPAPQTFLCDLDYVLGTCASRLLAGDVIQQGDVFAEVICPPFQTCSPGVPVTGDLVGTVATAVYFRIIAANPLGGPQTLEPGGGQVSMRFHAGVADGKVPCFVRFPLAGLPPDRDISPLSPVVVRFTEPMDPASVKPFDSLMILRKDPALPTPLNAYDFIPASLASTTDLREFTSTPVLPLTHDPALAPPSNAETYFLQVVGGANGATDLAGNPLETNVPRILFRLDPTAAKQDTNGFALRFESNDEVPTIGGTGLPVGAGLPELRGQFLLDPDRQVLKPRPVSHFSLAADRTQAIPAAMPVAPGVQTPLSRLGSKLQTLWRYCDLGLTLLDEANFNIDVEGINWAPAGGATISDHYTRFEMSLAHSRFLPDESIDPAQLPNVVPRYPLSGLVGTFAQNQADATNDPLRTMFPVQGGPTGYTVIPTDIFTGVSGTNFMPWPMNRNVPASFKRYYTWRDTALTIRAGGPGGPGAELEIVAGPNPAPPAPPVNGVPFPPNQVATIGLPLLMEFRCYPDQGASGLNFFDVSLAFVGNPPTLFPFFRTHSTGGVDTSLQTVAKDPDLELVADGGFNPAGTPPGITTPPSDQTFFLGQLDLVVRISRVHTIWFSTGSTLVQYAPPVLEPRPQDQPEGTQVVLHYRGATTLANNTLLTDATKLEAYGNRNTWITPPVAGADPVFLNNDSSWKSALSELNGASFFQARITLISNASSNLTPELSAVGFAYRK